MNVFKRANALARESISFVFSNKDVLKRHLAVIFPLFLACMLAKHFAVIYKIEWAGLAVLLLLSYLTSCFFLTWHRVSLRGVEEKPYSPLELNGSAVRFHLMFFAIFLSLDGLNRGMAYLEKNPALIEGNLLAAIGILIAAIAALVILFRLMFFLPAQSVGVTLSLKDTMRSSKGQIGIFILASLFFSLVFIVAVSIYTTVMASVNMFVIGDADMTKNAVAAISFVLAAPIYLVMFLYAAVEVTALSKLYQHGMENNS